MQEPQGDQPQSSTSPDYIKPASNFAMTYWLTAKPILTSPKVFFENMPQEGGMREPAIFLCVAAGVNAILTGLVNFNPMMIALAFGGSVLGTFLVAAVAYGLASAMGGKGTFEATFRVYAYSLATLLFAWIPIVGILAAIYTWVLNYFGLRKVHGLSDVKTAVVVLLGGILSTFVLALGACSLWLRSTLHF